MRKETFSKKGWTSPGEKEYTLKEVREETRSWGEKIVPVTGGWIVFESLVDYETWKKQK